MDSYLIRDPNQIKISTELPPYVEGVLKESMRKYPVASFGSLRQVRDRDGFLLHCPSESSKIEEDKIYFVPRGCYILVNFFVIHNLETNWGRDAGDFKPERWLSTDEEPNNPLTSLAIYNGGGLRNDELSFAPFSHGVRNCLG